MDRARAMGMLDAGMTRKDVAKGLNFHETTVQHWYTKYKAGESLEDRPRS